MFLKNVFVALLLIALFIGTSVEGKECRQRSDCTKMIIKCLRDVPRDEKGRRRMTPKCVRKGEVMVCSCETR
ncbi:unnamed protein product [Callosobruchus maculatus]|uniref:Uncharacterized protein n=1 Tax=Callosobruchus maculatus TaxID=64391 RepID=A0A653CGL8_CALMS|nr:unnamed protein product [Callosobruchus maculatus]